MKRNKSKDKKQVRKGKYEEKEEIIIIRIILGINLADSNIR